MEVGDRPAYTCITCAVAFKDADIQRGHYKTDWHRYNLKRKVAGMAPVTMEDFDKRKNAHDAQMKVKSVTRTGLSNDSWSALKDP